MTDNTFDNSELPDLDLHEMLEEDEYDDAIFMEELDEAMASAYADSKWSERLDELAEVPNWEKRIALYQEMRDDKTLTAEAAFYLISWAIEGMAQDKIIELGEVGNFNQRLIKIYQDHKMGPDECWEEGKEPAELIQLEKEFSEEVDKIFQAEYSRVGEEKMSELIINDPIKSAEMNCAGEAAIYDMISAELGDDEE